MAQKEEVAYNLSLYIVEVDISIIYVLVYILLNGPVRSVQ